MGTLVDLYEQRYRYGEFNRTLGRWIQRAATPWRLGEVRVYAEPNYLTRDTDIYIRTELLPDTPIWLSFSSDELLSLDEEWQIARITEEFDRKFKAIYTPPEGLIELGEN